MQQQGQQTQNLLLAHRQALPSPLQTAPAKLQEALPNEGQILAINPFLNNRPDPDHTDASGGCQNGFQ